MQPECLSLKPETLFTILIIVFHEEHSVLTQRQPEEVNIGSSDRLQLLGRGRGTRGLQSPQHLRHSMATKVRLDHRQQQHCRSVVHYPWAAEGYRSVGHLVPRCTERITDFDYFQV